MFPMFNMMNSCQEGGRCRPSPRHHCQRNPQFNPFNMSSQFVPFEGRFGNLMDNESPEYFQQCMQDAFPVVVDLLQKMAEPKRENSEHDGKQEKQQKDVNKVDDETKSEDGKKKSERKMNSTEELPQCAVLKDIFNHALSGSQNYDPRMNAKWETKVDCRGFLSSNIKVKIDEKQLLIKAFRKQETKDGLRTLTLSKSVSLPEDIDPKKIGCKLGPSGFLHIQAPFVNTRKSDSNKLVTDLFTQIMPGIAAFMQNFVHEEGDTQDVEKDESKKGTPKCCRKKKVDKDNKQTKEEKKNKENVVDEKTDQQNLDLVETTEDKQMVDATNSKALSNDADLTIETDNSIVDKSSGEVDGTSTITYDSEADEKQNKSHVDNSNTQVEHSESNDQQTIDPDQTSVMSTTPMQPIKLLPTQNTAPEEIHGDDETSVSSEDSFVRLSEFENENELITNTDTTTLDSTNQTTPASNTDSRHWLLKKDYSPVVRDQQSKSKKVSNTDSTSNIDTENVVLRIEMPSYNPESVRVSFDEGNRKLTITASKGQAGSKSSSPINKSVTISDDVDTSRLHCFFKDGALTVTAPHKNKSLIQNIPIKF